MPDFIETTGVVKDKDELHPLDDLLTLPEVARMLRLSRTTIHRLVQQRKIPFYTISHSLLFSKTEVEEFVVSSRVPRASEVV